MTINFQNTTHINKYPQANVKFASAPLDAPIEAVQKTIEKSIDTITGNENKKKKKSYKKTIAVVSSALVLSSFVMLLNPRYSNKFMNKMKGISHILQEKVNSSKENPIVNKMYKAGQSVIDWTQKCVNFCTNINTGKDVLFKYLCTDEKKNIYIRGHEKLEKILRTIDKGFVKIMKKPHEWITKVYDKIGVRTIKMKYSRANKRLDGFESLIKKLMKDIPADDRAKVQELLDQIGNDRKFFTESRIYKRLVQQGKSMSNLERDFKVRLRQYMSGFKNRFIDKGEHITGSLSFWADDLTKKDNARFIQQGEDALALLIGNDNGQKGAYTEIVNILKKHIKTDDVPLLESTYSSVAKKLKKANAAECVEFFERKRDMIAGGAPTDILTAVIGLGGCSYALGRAKDKDERLSKTITLGIPVVVGLATSLISSAMLLSGGTGLLLAGATGYAANLIGRYIDKKVLGNTDDEDDEKELDENNKKTKTQEVKNNA